jgi:F0F1-type ATP synthase assembly protein I
MKPNENPASAYVFAAGVAAQVGCLLIGIVGGAVLLGLFLDRLFGTKTLFIFLLLIASIPLTLWAIYKYTLYQSKRLQVPVPTKEDNISDD